MTKSDKAFLRWLMKNKPEISNGAASRVCYCAVSTVRKYRRVFASQGQSATQGEE